MQLSKSLDNGATTSRDDEHIGRSTYHISIPQYSGRARAPQPLTPGLVRHCPGWDNLTLLEGICKRKAPPSHLANKQGVRGEPVCHCDLQLTRTSCGRLGIDVLTGAGLGLSPERSLHYIAFW
jgi:hypothetical protein